MTSDPSKPVDIENIENIIMDFGSDGDDDDVFRLPMTKKVKKEGNTSSASLVTSLEVSR